MAKVEKIMSVPFQIFPLSFSYLSLYIKDVMRKYVQIADRVRIQKHSRARIRPVCFESFCGMINLRHV